MITIGHPNRQAGSDKADFIFSRKAMGIAKWFKSLSDKWVLASPEIDNLSTKKPKLLYEKDGKNVSFKEAARRFFLWPALVKAGKNRIKNLLESDTFKHVDSAKNLLKEIHELPFWAGVCEKKLKVVLKDAAISEAKNKSGNNNNDAEEYLKDEYLKQLTLSELETYIENPENLKAAIGGYLTKGGKLIVNSEKWLASFSRVQSAIAVKSYDSINKEDEDNMVTINAFLSNTHQENSSANTFMKMVIEKFNEINTAFTELSKSSSEKKEISQIPKSANNLSSVISDDFYSSMTTAEITENNNNIAYLLRESKIPLNDKEKLLLSHLEGKRKTLDFFEYESLKTLHFDFASNEYKALSEIRRILPNMLKVAMQDVRRKILDYEKNLRDEGYLELSNWQLIKHLETIENRSTDLEFFLSFFSLQKTNFDSLSWRGLGSIFEKNLADLKKQIPSYLHDPLERLAREFSTYLANPENEWKSAQIYKKSLQEELSKNRGQEITDPESAKHYFENQENLISEINNLVIKNETLMAITSTFDGQTILEGLLRKKKDFEALSNQEKDFFQSFLFNLRIMLASKADELSVALREKIIELQKFYFPDK